MIEPGKHHDRIFCRLQLRNIHHVHPEYEALSYVWGTSEERVKIICNGHVIGITRHLREALERVRLSDRPRLIWADALCINQKNVEERGHQVRLMSQIYRKASKVLIWAGQDENRYASSAFSLIRQIANGEVNHTDALCSANFEPYGCQTPHSK